MRARVVRLLVSAAALSSLVACGFEPMPVPSSGDIPPGPGLFTGESGELVIHGKP